ncbi:MAG: PQQ-dependent sugar dehydrogenase [Fibrobacteria bacterium]|nr:PQQ-dependent sugar dehydrogenase [Fibrobacteria bacterium]
MTNSLTILLLLVTIVNSIYAQYPKYSGTERPECVDLQDSDFKMTTLFKFKDDPSLKEPMRMDFYQDDSGNVNVYFIERYGKLKYYDARTKKLSLVGRLDVVASGNDEAGLIGMALDPDFKNNRLVYFYWTPVAPSVYRLSRFKVLGDSNKLDLTSEKVIIDIPDTRIGAGGTKGGYFHNGGSLFFDNKGDLWWTIGEHDHCNAIPEIYHNTTDKECSGEDNSSDAHSWYGSIVRIHPESDGSYTIPDNNFGEFWSEKFAEEGRMTLSQKYTDTSLVRPEIYAKGFRNPMSVSVDPVTGWAAVSECGAQCHKVDPAYYCPTDGLSEKHMLITEPSFQGWPYFHGNNHPFAMNASDEKNALKPVNNSPFNQGVDTLPPAIPGTYVYGAPKWGDNICSVGGTFFRYNWENPSDISLPPHFDGVMISSDLNTGWKRAIEIDSATGDFVKVSPDLWTSLLDTTINADLGKEAGNVMDLRHGPDGALYLLNYSQMQYLPDKTTGLYRIEYHGDCRITPVKRYTPKQRNVIKAGFIDVQGEYRAEFFKINGQKVYTFNGFDKEKLPLDHLPSSGLYKVRISTNNIIVNSVFMKM